MGIVPLDVHVLFLCEQDKLILRPNQLYRFVVGDHCHDCRELASAYGYEAADVFTWEDEGGTTYGTW